MKRLLAIGLSWFISFPAFGVDSYSNLNVKATTTTKTAVVNGTAGAGYIELDHQSSDTGTPGSGSNDVRVFAKSRGIYKVIDNGSGTPIVSELGAGTGSGELTYVSNPSGAVDTTGWTCVGDLAIAKTTTAAELPRENSTPTGLKITATAGTQSTADYCYTDLNIDDVDLSKVLKIEWAQHYLATYAAGQFATIVTTQADRTTALHTPVVSAIPAQDGVFGTTFVTGSTATLSLVIRATEDMTEGDGVVLSNVIVGPGQMVQGNGPDKQYVAGNTYNGVALAVTGTGLSATSRGVFIPYKTADGTSRLRFNMKCTVTATTVQTVSIAGVTFKNAQRQAFTLYSQTGGGTKTVLTAYASPNSGDLVWNTSANVDDPVYSGDVELESWPTWADSPQPLYIASGADNSVSALNLTTFPLTLVGNTNHTIRYAKYQRNKDGIDVWYRADFTNAGSATDLRIPIPTGLVIDTEKLGTTSSYVARVGDGTWITSGGSDIELWYGVDGTNTSVVVYRVDSGIKVQADSPANGHVFWGHFWVPIVGLTAQDYLGKMLTGFATAKVGSAGLVNNDSSNAGGTPIKGATDGSDASAGYVGEAVTTAKADGTTSLAVSDTWYTVQSLSIPAGSWEVDAGVTVITAGTTTPTNAAYELMTTAGSPSLPLRNLITSTPNNWSFLTNKMLLDQSSATTVYLRVSAGWSGGTAPYVQNGASTFIRYRRIR